MGVQDAPIKNLGATSMGSPPSCLLSSRIFFKMPTSWQVSTSYTFFAPGWPLSLPAALNFWWSPARQRQFLSPSAAAPRRSACMAILFRSRQVICMTGSRPCCSAMAAAAMLEMRTTAVWQSVMFAASQKPFSCCAFFMTSWGSALMGGPSSAVTAGLPLASTFSSVLPLFIRSSRTYILGTQIFADERRFKLTAISVVSA